MLGSMQTRIRKVHQDLEWYNSAHVLKCSTLWERSWRLCWCQVAPRSSPAPRALLAESLALAGSRVVPPSSVWQQKTGSRLWREGVGAYTGSIVWGWVRGCYPFFSSPPPSPRVVGRCSLRIYVLMILCVETRMRPGAWPGIWTYGGLR